jgi:hypothetical protein
MFYNIGPRKYDLGMTILLKHFKKNLREILKYSWLNYKANFNS